MTQDLEAWTYQDKSGTLTFPKPCFLICPYLQIK